jgi:hypothetical protein
VEKQLFKLCKVNDSLKNIILLDKQVIVEDLQKLSECESFSVVLALNIIHWPGHLQWKAKNTENVESPFPSGWFERSWRC